MNSVEIPILYSYSRMLSIFAIPVSMFGYIFDYENENQSFWSIGFCLTKTMVNCQIYNIKWWKIIAISKTEDIRKIENIHFKINITMLAI